MKLATISHTSFEIEVRVTKINEVMLRDKWLIALGGKICVSIVTELHTYFLLWMVKYNLAVRKI